MGNILLIEPDPSVAESLRRFLARRGHKVVIIAKLASAEAALRRHNAALILADYTAPQAAMAFLQEMRRRTSPPEVIFLSTTAAQEHTVEVLRAGAHEFLQKPPAPETLEMVVARALEKAGLKAQREPALANAAQGFGDIVGESVAMRRVYEAVRAVAPHRVGVLLTGESGTGKELIAQAIHSLSPRATKPFIKVNCGVFSEHVLESELFGHEKGAFTGAVTQRRGRFELADGGTLLLDEIGELPLQSQVKLLRVLQEGEFERVGGERTLRVDIRVLAATNIDLEVAVTQKRFREDLLYRLNVVHLHLPPLRERHEDIPALARHFLAKHGQGTEGSERLPRKTLEALQSYRWPGNVRELENCLQSALVSAKRGKILPQHMPPNVLRSEEATGGVLIPEGATLAEAERRLIAAALTRAKGNRTQAAKLLDIGLRTIHRKIEEYKL